MLGPTFVPFLSQLSRTWRQVAPEVDKQPQQVLYRRRLFTFISVRAYRPWDKCKALAALHLMIKFSIFIRLIFTEKGKDIGQLGLVGPLHMFQKLNCLSRGAAIVA